MGQGSIIGYEINEKTCQISFYNDKEMEPQTLEVDSDNFQIPLIIGKLRVNHMKEMSLLQSCSGIYSHLPVSSACSV